MAELPEYIPEEAVKVVYDNVSPELQRKLSQDDILMILDIELEFLEQSGATSNPSSIVQLPIQIDDDAMRYFIIHECAKENIYLTSDEVEEILEAENIYLKSLGLIDEEGMAPFYN